MVAHVHFFGEVVEPFLQSFVITTKHNNTAYFLFFPELVKMVLNPFEGVRENLSETGIVAGSLVIVEIALDVFEVTELGFDVMNDVFLLFGDVLAIQFPSDAIGTDFCEACLSTTVAAASIAATALEKHAIDEEPESHQDDEEDEPELAQEQEEMIPALNDDEDEDGKAEEDLELPPGDVAGNAFAHQEDEENDEDCGEEDQEEQLLDNISVVVDKLNALLRRVLLAKQVNQNVDDFSHTSLCLSTKA